MMVMVPVVVMVCVGHSFVPDPEISIGPRVSLWRRVVVVRRRDPSRRAGRESEVAPAELAAAALEAAKVDDRTILRGRAVVDYDELRPRKAAYQPLEAAFEQERLAAQLMGLAVGFEQHALASCLVDKLG